MIEEKQVTDLIRSIHYFNGYEGVAGRCIDPEYMETLKGSVEENLPSEEESAILQLTTFCMIILKNGFTVVGTSECCDPEDFCPEAGRKYAYEEAVKKIYPLVAYTKKTERHLVEQAPPVTDDYFDLITNGDYQTVVGTKVLRAAPMTRGDYNLARGWIIPENEDASDPGYIVQYVEGYISWSPKDVFEKAYHVVQQHTPKEVSASRSDFIDNRFTKVK